MLNKSKLLAWRQCPKRLWLEVNAPELADAGVTARSGERVGQAARQLFDLEGTGLLIDRFGVGSDAAVQKTADVLHERRPLFEAGFAAQDVMVFVDVLLPVENGWRLIEVKSSASAKDEHVADAAVQAHVVRAAGMVLDQVVVAHVDSGWTYPGGGDYCGLLAEADVTARVDALGADVAHWIEGARATLAAEAKPERETGAHCDNPYACPFQGHCGERLVKPIHPVAWLPGQLSKAAKAACADGAIVEMADLGEDVLNHLQRRVRRHTLEDSIYFDGAGARADVANLPRPLLFLDFETAQLDVPIWAGTRPFAQTPFQFSLHILDAADVLTDAAFLDLSGGDPSRPFAEALLAACGEAGSILVYNIAFERTRIAELAKRFSDLAPGLEALAGRMFDLQPVAKARYYHPDQHGSWSIKKVLPCIAPTLQYDELEGVGDGVQAMAAYLEAIGSKTPDDRRREIDGQLRRYCGLDTLAMVAVWAHFVGDKVLFDRVTQPGQPYTLTS